MNKIQQVILKIRLNNSWSYLPNNAKRCVSKSASNQLESKNVEKTYKDPKSAPTTLAFKETGEETNKKAQNISRAMSYYMEKMAERGGNNRHFV